LKKRTKNFWLAGVLAPTAKQPATSKSFLLLFFKKEALSFPLSERPPMPSWQSRLLDPVLRLQIKRKLGKARSAADVRRAFGGSLPAPRGARFSDDVIGGITGEWAAPSGMVAGTMLYLHGGGYIANTPKTYRPITGFYANRGIKVFTPDYRLAPENPFPAAVEDALAAYKGLLAGGIAPGGLAIGGDSAGGGLALATLLAAKAEGLPMPASAILFSPWTDLAITGATIKTNMKRDPMLHAKTLPDGAAFYLNGADPKNPLASPLYGALGGLPPMLITAGESEILRDDSTRLAERATLAGVAVSLKIWEGMPHVWQLFQVLLPEARTAMEDAARFATANFHG
jgi:acetyl esterase/lipase